MKWQCALLQRWLPEYPDGELSTFWRGRLQAHLERCPVCREEQAALKEVEAALKAAPVADPGQDFWRQFSREMHLKLVQADQAGNMVPAPRSPWWGRLPYLLGAPALAGLLIWVAVGYLNPERPGPAPAAQMAKSQPPAVTAPAVEMAKKKSAAPAEKVAATPQALPPSDETKNFVYVSKSNGNSGEEAAPDDESDDLDATLAGMTSQEREAFLKKLSQHEKDGSCIRKYSAIAWV
jgi:anti-sigma factor RsiW